MGAHVGFVQRFTVFELDKGDDFFIGVLVFHADDGCGFDGVEFVNRLFDFARINVLPFGNNQVFFTIDDKDKAIFVYRDKIACFQPSVDDGFVRGIAHIQVALHDRTAFDDEFAHFARRHFDQFVVDGFDFQSGQGDADAAGFLPFGRVDGDNGRAFAQAVAFQKLGARELRFKIKDGLFRQRRAAADKQTDAVEPSEIPRDFRFAHGGVNRGHTQKHGRAFE